MQEGKQAYRHTHLVRIRGVESHGSHTGRTLSLLNMGSHLHGYTAVMKAADADSFSRQSQAQQADTQGCGARWNLHCPSTHSKQRLHWTPLQDLPLHLPLHLPFLQCFPSQSPHGVPLSIGSPAEVQAALRWFAVFYMTAE